MNDSRHLIVRGGPMKPLRSLLTFAIVVTLAAAAPADAAKKKIAKANKGTRGVVVAVDEKAKTFTYRTGKKKDPEAKEVTVSFSATTKFVKAGEAGPVDAKASDLAVKSRVAVVTEKKDGK